MKSRYIPAIITLTASLITCLVCILKPYGVIYSLELLLATIIIFYIIGIVAKKIIAKTIQEDGIQIDELEVEDSEETDDLTQADSEETNE